MSSEQPGSPTEPKAHSVRGPGRVQLGPAALEALDALAKKERKTRVAIIESAIFDRYAKLEGGAERTAIDQKLDYIISMLEAR